MPIIGGSIRAISDNGAGCVLTVRAGKGRRDRRVFLTQGACRLVRAWIEARGDDDGPLVCPVDASGRVRVSRLGGDSVHYILKKRQEKAGLDGITPHDFRRAMITRLLAAGVDVFTVQQLAGHADAVTTARYDRRGEEARRKAVGHLRLPVTACVTASSKLVLRGREVLRPPRPVEA